MTQISPSLAEGARTMPSREFFIRQACLNALMHEMPNCYAADGPAQTAKWLLTLWDVPSVDFIRQARAEFRALVSRFTVTDIFTAGRPIL